MSKKNFKNNKPYTKRNSEGKVDIDDKKKTRNDASWHVLNPELLKNFGKLNFNYPIGVGLRLHNEVDAPNLELRVPGVASINYLPNAGISASGTASGLNLAANALYSDVRHANSGHANYNAPDLMMYILAMDSIYGFYAWCCEVYKRMKTYQQRNRYMPKVLCDAMNVDYDDVIANIDEFEGFLAWVPTIIRQRAIPAKLDMFKYHIMRPLDLFTDDKDVPEKGQIYMYNPVCVYKYVGYTDKKGGRLEPIWLRPFGTLGRTTKLKVSDLRSIMMDCLAAVVNDEDTGIMMGDLIKAYGSDAMINIAPTYNQEATLVYNETELRTIENIKFTGIPDDEISGFYIAQDPNGTGTEGGAIIYDPWFYQNDVTAFTDFYPVNAGKDPAPEELVEILRNMSAQYMVDESFHAVPGQPGIQMPQAHYKECGSILVSSIDFYMLPKNGNATKGTLQFNCVSDADFNSTFAWAMQFKFHPLMIAVNKTMAEQADKAWVPGAIAGTVTYGILNDTTNLTIASREYLDRYQNTSILSELNILA